MSAAAMDLKAWREIVAAYRDATSAIDAAFAGPPPDLGALVAKIERRIEVLRRRLGAKQAGVVAPLAFLLDEKVLARITTIELDVTWPLLGRTFANTELGGYVFFEKADELRDAGAPSSLALQVYLFCLGEGFGGRYAEDAEALAEYREWLFEKVSAVAPQGAPPRPAKLPAAPRPWPQFAAAAAAAVASWLGVLWAVSSRM